MYEHKKSARIKTEYRIIVVSLQRGKRKLARAHLIEYKSNYQNGNP